MKGATPLAIVSVALLGTLAFGAGGAFAQVQATMDFEGLPEGMLVSRLSSGSGIGGDRVTGSVAVYGDRAPVGDGTRNTAIVYDAACGGRGAAGCTGGETDKYKPHLGKVLTIAKSSADGNRDGFADAPDTAGQGGELAFDFSAFGPGSVTVLSLDVLDAERGGWVELYARGALVGVVRYSPTRNNGLATVAIGHSGIDRMKIRVEDSGVIDNVRLAFGPPASVCGSLRVSVRRVALARHTAVLAIVRDTQGAPMIGMRVVARGAGVRASRVTNVRGVARFALRPRRTGVIRFAVPTSSRCAARIAARGSRTAVPRPPKPLVG